MSSKYPYLYCAKNVLYEWASDGKNRYCDGPNGKGVNDHCVEWCDACTNEKELVESIGRYVIRKMGVQS